MNENEENKKEKISPSGFMRELRPEYYSDTEDRAEYVLDSPLLEYHLESITQHNQTYDFELFCRKLCERAICPNLRPHTGPDGGGDSKVDSETFPVSEEIYSLFYIGEQSAAHDRWAFAFSAKEDWKSKVKSDVKKIAETQRGYKRIIFVTSRFAKDKVRSELEEQLSKEYEIPVTIHDRSWIVKEIIENNRKDLAYNYLKVGQTKSDPLRLGPEDYSRKQQLADIEREIDDLGAFSGMERQLATEALVAAKLSRNLELPRSETDGRFIRAIRLAKAHGTHRQKLEAQYEHIWTAFWWFDDFNFLIEHYEDFEAQIIDAGSAIELEFLCNLLQLFFNSVIHQHLTASQCQLNERTHRLRQALKKMAGESDRPNNSLEAQMSLLILKTNEAIVKEDREALPEIWKKYKVLLEKAEGLGEFNANRLVQMVEIAGNIAGNDLSYNELVEKMAEFVSKRKSEAEGALILLKRAQKLNLDSNFEMIRLLGRAAIGLTKKEYSDDLIETIILLTVAYRSAGMLWAARASCIFLAASLIIEGEENSEIPARFVPVMKTFAWISLELRQLPDFLFAMQMLNGAFATLPLSDESKSKLREDVSMLDGALGCLLINREEAELKKLENLPDILGALGLFAARSALLYTMGHLSVLREDGSMPLSETDEDVKKFFSIMASQPIAQEVSGQFLLNDGASQTLNTHVLGTTIEVLIQGSPQSVLIAEVVLGSLEAFFATAIERRILSHTDLFHIDLIESDDAMQPSFSVTELEPKGKIIWPRNLSVADFERQQTVLEFLREVCIKVLVKSCIIKDIESLTKELFVDEAVQGRMTMVAVAPNSFHRIASRPITQLSDWGKAIKKSYKTSGQRPTLDRIDLKAAYTASNEDKKFHQAFSDIKDHREMSVHSVIDVHAWDQAKWLGMGYFQTAPSEPPYAAFLFKNEEGARIIFERWRERFGSDDKNGEIHISIIRQLPNLNPYHYCLQITSKPPEIGDPQSSQVIAMASRSKIMEPGNNINLESFLAAYREHNKYYVLPAIVRSNGQPDMLSNLAILKNQLNIKFAKDVGEHDIEQMSLRSFDL